MKLLIVDDSAIIRRTIESCYRGESIFTEVETASDGVLALAVFKQLMPDVVTLDITMPGLDGLSACEQMIEIKPDAQILVISALADHHTAIEALCRGAAQFICKPFSDEDLKEALDDICQERDEEGQEAAQRATPVMRSTQMKPTSAIPQKKEEFSDTTRIVFLQDPEN